LTSLITNLPTIIKEIVKAMPQIISGIVSALGNGVSQLADVGKNLVRGLWNGIQSLASWIWDKVSGWAKDLWNGICSFFGIKSPSKKFAELGMYMSQGLGIGFVDEMKNVDKDILKAIPSDFDINTRTHLNSVVDDRSLRRPLMQGRLLSETHPDRLWCRFRSTLTARKSRQQPAQYKAGLLPPTAVHWGDLIWTL
jgi:hypothetical protein